MAICELLAGRFDDPAMGASPKLDWAQLVEQLYRVTRAILHALAYGEELTLLVPLGRSRSTLQTHKQRLAGLIN